MKRHESIFIFWKLFRITSNGNSSVITEICNNKLDTL